MVHAEELARRISSDSVSRAACRNLYLPSDPDRCPVAAPRLCIDGIAMVQTDARYAGYSTAQAKNVYEELRQKIAAMPGVQSAVLIKDDPMTTIGLPVVVEHGGAETGPGVVAGAICASPGFFDLLKIPILY